MTDDRKNKLKREMEIASAYRARRWLGKDKKLTPAITAKEARTRQP